MKYILRIAVVILFASGLFSCSECIKGKGHPVSETRKIGDFDKIVLNFNADVSVDVVPKTTMQIHGQKNILKYVKTKVKNNTLYITSNKCFVDIDPVTINVFTPALNEVTVNGGGSVNIRHPVVLDKIVLEINGNGKIFADMYSNTVDATINGSGEIVANGTSHNQNVNIEGPGIYQASGLRTDNSLIKINGPGKAEVSSLNSLKVEINGNGSVKYFGNPEIKSEISGDGTLSKIIQE